VATPLRSSFGSGTLGAMGKGSRVRAQRRVQTPKLRRGEGAAKSRRTLYALVGAAALLLAAVLIAASVFSRDGDTSSPAAATVDGSETAALLAGIPQDGTALGRPDSPVTLVELADFQCPFCGVFARDALPEIIREYVRTGKVRIEYRALGFIGPDSVEAREFALAAGEQDRLWHVADLLFEHQGAENSGWVNEAQLTAIGRAVPGLDVEQALADRSSDAVEEAAADAEAEATRFGITSTPSFLAGRTGAELERVEIDSLEADALTPTLDRLLSE
jgi:protein-disulfide isomerase